MNRGGAEIQCAQKADLPGAHGQWLACGNPPITNRRQIETAMQMHKFTAV